MNPIEKRYILRSFITMSAYVAMTYGSKLALRSFAADWPVWCKALLAVAPVLPVALFCKAYVMYLNECDELVRRIELEAIGLSSVAVGLLFLSMGLLGNASIIALDGTNVAVWAFPLLCSFYCITRWFASRRYS